MDNNLSTKKLTLSKNLIKKIEEKYLKNKTNIRVGNLIKISYKLKEGDKERLQNYEGLVIGIQNRSIGKSFTLRRTIQGIGIEQLFLLNSPKIDSILIKDIAKVSKSKLYYLRSSIRNSIKGKAF
jgi:large subunit ribosomal protein L19